MSASSGQSPRSNSSLHGDYVGEATTSFKQLDKLWNRASIGKRRKQAIYTGCVVSNMLYSLDPVWLLKADRARLDAFHCRCLRRIVGVLPSFISRVSNADILKRAGAKPLSEVLLYRQEKAYSKIATSGHNSLVRQVVCEQDGLPKCWALHRRRGRPRQQWASSVYGLRQSRRSPPPTPPSSFLQR